MAKGEKNYKISNWILTKRATYLLENLVLQALVPITAG